MSDSVGAARLRSFVERIERMEEEIAAANADKREIYAEAKHARYDVKALKAVIAIRRKRAVDAEGLQEHDAMVALYMGALDGEPEAGTPIATRAPAPARATDSTPGPGLPTSAGGATTHAAPAPARASTPAGAGALAQSKPGEGAVPATYGDIDHPDFLRRARAAG